ncbi:MAG: hypothetical protein DLM61_03170 [Pseudonocardiales bacterium]|nr:MAG: hypothetical protein DLM61_03170 [Pseudonocardiales bacterium]
MTAERRSDVARLGELLPVVKLACTACQLVYTPDPANFETGNTGCPRCGGWTWIAELVPSAEVGGGQR